MRSTWTASAVLEKFYFHNWLLSSWVFYYGFICVFMYICIYVSQAHLYQLLKKNVCDNKAGSQCILYWGESMASSRDWKTTSEARGELRPG